MHKLNSFHDVLDYNDYHPGLFAVNPDYTEYIPAGYLTSDIYSGKEDKAKIKYLTYNDLRRFDFNSSSLGRVYSYLYFIQGLLLHKNEIAFCVAVKSSFVKRIYQSFFDYFEDSISINIYEQIEDEEDRRWFIRTLAVEYFMNTVDSNMKHNTVLFVNPKVCKYIEEQFLGGYAVTEQLRRIESHASNVIEDEVNDYFLSSLFVTVEKPKFKSITAPEKLVVSLLNKESDVEEYVEV